MATIEADYLVIGGGCQPGGHWTTAYPLVRLHQPSAYYGVNSRPLGTDTIDYFPTRSAGPYRTRKFRWTGCE